MSYCLFCRSRTNAIWLDANLLILSSLSEQYPVGSLVWLHDPTKKKGLCRKLQLPWEGPYQVIQILSDLVYAIQLSKHTKPKIVHHDRLKAYFREFG
jgi:hypothetical protein